METPLSRLPADIRAECSPTVEPIERGSLHDEVTSRVRDMVVDAQDRWSAAMAEHERIVDALRARDADRLARALREHLDNTWPRVSAVVVAPDRGV